jgi:hypothetical protein
MSIDATSPVTALNRPNYQQIRSDFKSLQNDLQSGNLANAQTDFATLLNDAPQLNNQLQSGAAATGAATTSQSSALNALSTSLQAGDLTGAQSALTSLGQSFGGGQSVFNSSGQVHHHHRHHHHHDNDQDSSPSGLASGNQAIQSDFQALSSALQSGNIASAQQALAQLQKDDPQFAAISNPIAVPAAPVA